MATEAVSARTESLSARPATASASPAPSARKAAGGWLSPEGQYGSGLSSPLNRRSGGVSPRSDVFSMSGGLPRRPGLGSRKVILDPATPSMRGDPDSLFEPPTATPEPTGPGLSPYMMYLPPAAATALQEGGQLGPNAPAT
eukprot:RCo029073